MTDYKQKFDLLIRNYFKNINCFTDFVNGTYFHGNQIIYVNDVKLYDGEYSGKLLNKSYVKRSRDNLMSVYVGNHESLVAFEHQSTYDGSIFQRVMEYDYLTYKRQYLDYKDTKRKIISTMTIVLYYGYKKWKHPLSYHDMMKSIPQELRLFINTNFYPLIIVDELDESLFQEKKNKQLILGLKFIHNKIEKQEMLYVDYEVGEILSVLAGDEEAFKHIQVNKEGEIDMCEYITEMKRRERKLGEKEGLKKGRLNEKCETLIQLLKVKLNHLSKDTEKIIYQSNMDKLNQLTIKIFQVNNEEDVKTILEN